MDKLRAMQMAVQIEEDGSLTAAAGSLGTSLAAVVRGLAALEEHLGARLFHRTTRRVVPTPEGERYLARCRDILAAVAAADADLAEGPPRGPLVITAPVLFGERHVAPLVTRFAQAHPEVRCRLVLLDRFVDLVDEGVDVGVRIGDLADSSLVARTVGEVRTRVVASRSCLRRHGAPETPQDLRDRPCLGVDGARERAWTFQQDGRRVKVAVTPAMSFNHAGAARIACEAGAGFAQLLSYQVDEAVASRRLVPVLTGFEAPPQPVRLIHPPGRPLPSRTRAFVEMAAASLRGALGRGG